MEAEPIKIPLNGIVRNTPDNTCDDGVMQDMCNLRSKDGALRPVSCSSMSEIKTDDHTSNIYIHKNAGYEHWIKKTENSDIKLEWFASKIGGNISRLSNPITIYTGDFDVVVFIGHICVIKSKDGINYSFFNNGNYLPLENINEFPEFICEVSVKYRQSEYTDLHSLGEPDAQSIEKINKKSEYGSYLKTVRDLKSIDCLAGEFCIIGAFRLYDGSYICPTAPLVLGDLNLRKYEMGQNNNDMNWRVVVGGRMLKITLSDKTKSTLKLLDKIITSVAFFCSDNILSDNPYNEDGSISQPKALSDRYSNITTFYKVAEISSSKIEDKVLITKEQSLVSLVNNEAFNYSISERYIPKSVFLYNSKLHISNIDVLIKNTGGNYVVFDAVNEDTSGSRANYADDLYYKAEINIEKMVVSIYIKNNNNQETVVLKTFNQIETKIGNCEKHAFLSRFIVYPDPRAYKVVFEIKYKAKETTYELSPSTHTSSDGYINTSGRRPDSIGNRGDNSPNTPKSTTIETDNFKKVTFPLIKSKDGTCATYTNISTIDKIGRDGRTYSQTSILNIDVSKGDNINCFTEKERNIIENRPNILKVSKVNNPFVFAPENTYTCGNGEIIGMSSLVGDVSSGTPYGTFPLYVFCSDGIKLLETGTGSVYYTKTSDVGRDVCNNKDSITPTDKGVIFATDRGLMIINGIETVELSTTLEGDAKAYINNLDEFQKGINPTLLPEALRKYTNLSVIDSSGVLKDIKNAKIAYNYKENELCVYTKGNFYYSYNFANGTWGKVKSEEIINFFNNYPDLYCIDQSGDIMNISKEDNTKPVDCMFLTRPIKNGTSEFKKVSRVILRGEFYTDKKVRLLVYGSIDGSNWAMLGGIDKDNIRDLGTITNRYLCKFFMFAFCGSLLPGSSINYLEVAAVSKFGNKIR